MRILNIKNKNLNFISKKYQLVNKTTIFKN